MQERSQRGVENKKMKKRNSRTVVNLMRERNKLEYFWRNRLVSSQWYMYPCEFEVDGKTHNSTEQYMMQQKAGMSFLKCFYLYLQFFFISLFLYRQTCL